MMAIIDHDDNDDNDEKEFLALGQPCGLGSRLDCLGKPVKAWLEHSMSHTPHLHHLDDI